ncbi:MAG: ABC transporter permease [Candidatus Riflebacteria bacterium]|nr:ABC transporter permease [Candidatus Riflebacteria bacterium]
MDWFTMALRNILKNGRRSAFTISAIAFGFAAINLFAGFTRYIFSNLQETQIYLTTNGHLMVFKTGFNPNHLMSSQAQLITSHEIREVRAICKDDPRFVVVSPKLVFMGLLSNGEESSPFIGIGKVIKETNQIHKRASGRLARVSFSDGKEMTKETEPQAPPPPPVAALAPVPASAAPGDAPEPPPKRHELVLARGLARKLNLKAGSMVTAMATTVNGQVNALEAEVVALIDVAMEILDSMVIEAPLTFAQELYDTDGADRIVILLERGTDLVSVRDELKQKLAARKLGLEVRPWYEVDRTTEKIADMLHVIFVFLFTIFLIIALMSVVNTIGMAVTERTREIGTLRALGVKRRGIVTMFACESMLLGTLGSVAGVGLTLAGWLIVRVTDPHWTPPQVPKAIPLEVHLAPEHMLVTFVSLVVLSLVVAIWPAQRAARGSIVDALGHV